MKPLEEQTLVRRIVTTMIIVIVVLLLLSLGGWISGGWEAQGEPAPITKYEAELIAIDREAVKIAYRDQIQHLFQVWMKDEHGQPQRAQVGARQARRAYIDVMNVLEERERKSKELAR